MLTPLCVLLSSVGVAAHGWVSQPVARNVLICDSRGEDVNGCKADRETKPPDTVSGNICAGYNHMAISDDAFNQILTPGPVQAVYSPGQVVEMTWHVWADHGGHYAYRICTDGSDTEECFQKLVLSNTQGQQSMNVYHGSRVDYVDEMVIPDISCERCTLNWFWHGDPAFEDTTFSNCIDISISGGGPTPVPPPSPTPVPPSGTCSSTSGDCIGNDIGDVSAYSEEDCCKACQDRNGCGAAVFVRGGQYGNRCYMKSSCNPTGGCAGDSCSVVSPAPGPPPTPSPVPSPAPSPSGCPGGSLSICIEQCPKDDAVVYKVCVDECMDRCIGGESLSI